MFRNFLWAFVEKGGFFLIQFVSVLVLSRLLSPSDYGVYGTMVLVISIAEMLVDSGFGGALIQKKDISQVDIDTLFWTNVGISLILYVVLFAISPYVQKIYKISELSFYLRIIGLTIIFYSFTIVQITILQKNLLFRKSALIMLCSSMISIGIAIVAAICDLGIWALIIQQICQSLFLALFLWIFGNTRISFGFSKQSFFQLWQFGSKLLGANLLQTLYNNICNSVIPKIASLNQAGNYAQASKINSIPVNIMMTTVDKVAFPVLSKETDVKCLVDKARSLNRVLLFIIIPLFPLLSLYSKEIVLIVLGSRWVEAGHFLSIIAWGGWGLLVQTLCRNIYKSIGDTRTILKVDIFKTILGLLTILSASLFGVQFLLWGLTFSMYFGAIIYIYRTNHDNLLTYKEQIDDFFLPVFLSIVLYILFVFLNKCFSENWYNLFGSLLFIGGYILLNHIVKNPVLFNIIKSIKMLIDQSE